MYLENRIDEAMLPGPDDGHLERDALGKEVVNGASATKYRIHGTTREGHPFEGTMWMTKHEIPVRVLSGQGTERVRMELSNLVVGPQDSSLFEIPAGYQRFELPAPSKADLDALRRETGRGLGPPPGR